MVRPCNRKRQVTWIRPLFEQAREERDGIRADRIGRPLELGLKPLTQAFQPKRCLQMLPDRMRRGRKPEIDAAIRVHQNRFAADLRQQQMRRARNQRIWRGQ